MAANLDPEAFASRTFWLTMICTALYVGAVILFVL